MTGGTAEAEICCGENSPLAFRANDQGPSSNLLISSSG